MQEIKLNVPAPRYTSYPPVPFWDNVGVTSDIWFQEVRKAFQAGNGEVNLYLHLLFCESLCTYCACNTRITTDHRVEKPYVDRMLKEWAMYTKAVGETPVITDLHLGGGTPTFFSPECLQELLGGILSTSKLSTGTTMSFEAHPASTTTEHLEVLYNLGFKRMSLGVQDFDPKVMKLINRKQSVEQVKAITNLARIIGYNSINFDLIYGLPAQTISSVEHTINEVVGIRPERIALYGYAHVPKMKPAQSSYEQLLPDGDMRAELCEFSKEMLVKAGYIEIGLDHYALPGDELLTASRNGTLHRNFMGYTTKSGPLLVGLGPSAISDAHTMFAQNASKLEDWNKSIDDNKWPGIKGHLMTKDDMILRKHILNIMCQFETNWIGDMAECSFLQGIYDRLVPFEQQGLVKLSREGVRVLPEGKKFLRHIGMCFDARFHQKNTSSTVFSNAS